MSAQQTGRIYKAALYLRLSKDDEGAQEKARVLKHKELF